ncbi:hypothetical protein [Bradyrhizobium sp. STM 3557]|uniref:hypothetical protein n=1 Tax=Bradyrhizobium sp. STM 3557 TaxID=578920 RepID=UPI003890C6A6
MSRVRSLLTGPRERAGLWRGEYRCRRCGPSAVRGIGFAPETIALAKRDLPRLSFVQEMPTMTAYLISLAIAGLVALAICDALL